MQYGDVQGPINKEPDEKLDNPTEKSAVNSVSGIRRLYVNLINHNNQNLLLVVLSDVNNNNNKIIYIAREISEKSESFHPQQHEQSPALSSPSFKNELSLSSEIENAKKREIQSMSDDNAKPNCSTRPDTTPIINSSLLYSNSVVIFMLNLLFLLLCCCSKYLSMGSILFFRIVWFLLRKLLAQEKLFVSLFLVFCLRSFLNKNNHHRFVMLKQNKKIIMSSDKKYSTGLRKAKKRKATF
jgi:hypothetical protein